MRALLAIVFSLVLFNAKSLAQCDNGVFIPEKFDWKLMTDSTRFKPSFAGNAPDRYTFTIHDKWGETVFHSENPLQGWNGLMNNRKGNCTAGTFMWSLDCAWTGDSVSVFCMGYVTCVNSAVVRITTLDTLQCRPSVYIPNVITPNGDGSNDVFLPQFGCPPLNYTMQIFDRWGNLIFETKDRSAGWDGTSKGEQQPQDVYVCKISWKTYEGDELRTYINHVTLIR